MPLFKVDPEKCTLCGACVEECPPGVIEFGGQEGMPQPTEMAEELCIQCGHCVAICPESALNLRFMKPEDCRPVREELSASWEEVEQLIFSRRSIRNFIPQGVERKTLERLLEIAGYAPTARNLRPVHWLVIDGREKVNRLAAIVIAWMREMIEAGDDSRFPLGVMTKTVADWDQGRDRIARGAPQVVFAHGPLDLPASPSSCLIALTTLDLAAPSFGLGTCWAGYLNTAAGFYLPMAETLALPAGHQSFGAMMIGRPVHRYPRAPVRAGLPTTWR